MRFDIITLFPQMFAGFMECGVVGRALNNALLEMQLWQLRDFAPPPHFNVDDRPYGGGPGMVMDPRVLDCALDAVCEQGEKPLVVVMSASGRLLTDTLAAGIARKKRVALVAGRYSGVDERFVETRAHMEISVGDYVVSGGELPAMILVDAVARKLDGVLGNSSSAADDAFASALLDYPRYTRPEEHRGLKVPQVLLGGDHAAIARWRRAQAYRRTLQRRPDLIEQGALGEREIRALEQLLQDVENRRD